MGLGHLLQVSLLQHRAKNLLSLPSKAISSVDLVGRQVCSRESAWRVGWVEFYINKPHWTGSGEPYILLTDLFQTDLSSTGCMEPSKVHYNCFCHLVYFPSKIMRVNLAPNKKETLLMLAGMAPRSVSVDFDGKSVERIRKREVSVNLEKYLVAVISWRRPRLVLSSTITRGGWR